MSTKATFASPDESFAKMTKTVREGLGKSQEDVAAEMSRLGYRFHQSTMYKIENGDRKVTVGEAHALAMILNVELEELILGEADSLESMERRLRLTADDALTAILAMDDAASDLAKKLRYLTWAVSEFDEKGYVTKIEPDEEPRSAHENYGALAAFSLHEDFKAALRDVVWPNNEIQRLFDDILGIVELGPMEAE